jgi:hypothetical protein
VSDLWYRIEIGMIGVLDTAVYGLAYWIRDLLTAWHL